MCSASPASTSAIGCRVVAMHAASKVTTAEACSTGSHSKSSPSNSDCGILVCSFSAYIGQSCCSWPGENTNAQQSILAVPPTASVMCRTVRRPVALSTKHTRRRTAVHNVMDRSRAAWELLVFLSDGRYHGYGVGHEKLTATQLQTEMEGKQLPMPSGDGIANMERNEFGY